MRHSVGVSDVAIRVSRSRRAAESGVGAPRVSCLRIYSGKFVVGRWKRNHSRCQGAAYRLPVCRRKCRLCYSMLLCRQHPHWCRTHRTFPLQMRHWHVSQLTASQPLAAVHTSVTFAELSVHQVIFAVHSTRAKGSGRLQWHALMVLHWRMVCRVRVHPMQLADDLVQGPGVVAPQVVRSTSESLAR